MPLGKALGPEVILAWEMNREPLPTIHGAPLRVVVPGFIGARSVRRLRRIVLSEEPSANYFQATAYRLLPPGVDPKQAGPGDGLSLSPVALNSAFFLPDRSIVPAGTNRLAGYAYAGDDRTVSRVDVSQDDGATWQIAVLEEASNPWTWQFWHADLDLERGHHTAVVRAWDSTGALQPARPEDVCNPKGYVNNSWKRVELDAR
ncbi:molybdopterin-dependent oxidoreductase [uncultured Amnibacterium sp.]|uniref:molybdopterin-dependent oxidoreductase n=1 Tax=uncultured Amnibacterium sp. TaxID=1631851 RepID=UPI0035CC6BD2